MTADSPRPIADRAAAIAGVVLIVAPLLAFVVKFFSFGWLFFVILGALFVIVPGYALQLVIAIGGFLRARGSIRTATGRRRAITAAWVTSIGVVLTGFFLVDGGDMKWGSTFMYLFGMDSDPSAEAVSHALFWVASAAWVIGWGWLVVEWILAMVARRREKLLTPAA